MFAQGVAASKKKKQKKLKRTIKNMQKRERKADGAVDTRFAAMHLINDPQALAELLFGKLQVGHMSTTPRCSSSSSCAASSACISSSCSTCTHFCSATFNRVS